MPSSNTLISYPLHSWLFLYAISVLYTYSKHPTYSGDMGLRVYILSPQYFKIAVIQLCSDAHTGLPSLNGAYTCPHPALIDTGNDNHAWARRLKFATGPKSFHVEVLCSAKSTPLHSWHSPRTYAILCRAYKILHHVLNIMCGTGCVPRFCAISVSTTPHPFIFELVVIFKISLKSRTSDQKAHQAQTLGTFQEDTDSRMNDNAVRYRCPYQPKSMCGAVSFKIGFFTRA